MGNSKLLCTAGPSPYGGRFHPQGVGRGCLEEVLAPFGCTGLKPQQHTLGWGSEYEGVCHVR